MERFQLGICCRWFGNTRTIGQKQLEQFRDAIVEKKKDPYAMVLNQAKLPMSLLQDPKTSGRSHILDVESFETTFGSKSTRKKPKGPPPPHDVVMLCV